MIKFQFESQAETINVNRYIDWNLCKWLSMQAISMTCTIKQENVCYVLMERISFIALVLVLYQFVLMSE